MATKVTPTTATLAAAALIGVGGFIVEKLPDGSMNIQNPIPPKVYMHVEQAGRNRYPSIREQLPDSLPAGKDMHILCVIGGEMVSHSMFTIPEPSDSNHTVSGIVRLYCSDVRKTIEPDTTGLGALRDSLSQIDSTVSE